MRPEAEFTRRMANVYSHKSNGRETDFRESLATTAGGRALFERFRLCLHEQGLARPGCPDEEKGDRYERRHEGEARREERCLRLARRDRAHERQAGLGLGGDADHDVVAGRIGVRGSKGAILRTAVSGNSTTRPKRSRRLGNETGKRRGKGPSQGSSET